MAAAPSGASDIVTNIDLVADIPIKDRAATNFTTYSIKTEEYVPESRNNIEVLPTGDDDVQRDGTDDDGTNGTVETSIKTTSSSSTKMHTQTGSAPPVLPPTEDNTDISMFQYFYETVEIGAETVISTACLSDDRNETVVTNSDNVVAVAVPTVERQPSIISAISQESFPSAKTEDPVQQENPSEGFEVQAADLGLHETAAHGFESQPDKWCGISHAIMWSNKDIIGNAVNIRSEVLNILGSTFAVETEGMEIDDSMLVNKSTCAQTMENNDATPNIETPSSVEQLLKEIDTIGNSLSVETEKDQFVEKLVSVKHHLREINNLLHSAADEEMAEYVRVILRAAVLDAEVDTRRAELELKKIRLESMQVENQFDALHGVPTGVASGSGNVLEQVWNKMLRWKKTNFKR